MNKKKGILISLVVVLILLIVGLGYYFITKEDKITTLNLIEKQWIESNKNNVIDMSIVNDIPILSYNGDGLIIEFLDSLKEKTELSFNKVSYNLNDENNKEYSFKLVNEVTDKDILIYTDNYALITKDTSYINIESLKGITIGVLNDDLSNANNYLFEADVTYKTYNTKDEMLTALNNNEVNAIVLLKTTYLKDVVSNNYKIAYNISDYKKYYVLSLGSEEKLNNILTKYYNKWSSENYESSYNLFLSNNYFKFKEISDSEEVKFRSKRYNYGFIENAPYDIILNGKLSGINGELLKDFSAFTNAEISYKKFNNLNDLLESFNKNEIDLFYGINGEVEYKIDIINTIGAYDNKFVILKHATNDNIVKSIKSLSNVLVIKNSKVEEYLSKNNVSFKQYDNLKDLVNNIDKNDVIIMDVNNYNYYKEKLSEYIVSNEFLLEIFDFTIRDIGENEVFADIFNFYLSFNDTNKYVTNGLKNVIIVDKAPIILKYLAISIGSILIVLLLLLAIIKLKPKKKNVSLSKEDKLRFIDALTSLKNRNYLNNCIEKWDSSEVYPQTIIIIDLNNIAYINDNYGHSEGDLVIKQAANILILNQMDNSEIIRTNGNEFLIYLVGYEEKQIITYMRKLNKELKELKHNFGAAIGYSMINDAIKTIDDAVNEATIDMRNNKEEANKK